MSAIRKTYMAKSKNRLSIYAFVDGRPVLCEFRNASKSNPLLKGTFTTNNPKLIDALEKDSGFNKKFILSATLDDDSKVENLEFRSLDINPKVKTEEPAKVPESKPVESKKDESKKEPSETAEGPKEDNSLPKDVKIVSKDIVGNVQEAKEWLKKEFKDLTLKQLGNKKIVLEVAKQKNVHFEGVSE